MFGLSKGERAYNEFYYKEITKAQSQASDENLNIEEEIESILKRNNVDKIRPRATGSGIRVYTPRQLSQVISDILKLPNPMAGYMVLYSIRSAIRKLSLPIGFQGDLMMSFEKIRAINPNLADNGAEFLAHTLCMMPNAFKSPSLRKAIKTHKNIGVAYTEAFIGEEGVRKLKKEYFVAESEAARGRVHWDDRIKSLVREKLFEIDTYIASLISD